MNSSLWSRCRARWRRLGSSGLSRGTAAAAAAYPVRALLFRAGTSAAAQSDRVRCRRPDDVRRKEARRARAAAPAAGAAWPPCWPWQWLRVPAPWQERGGAAIGVGPSTGTSGGDGGAIDSGAGTTAGGVCRPGRPAPRSRDGADGGDREQDRGANSSARWSEFRGCASASRTARVAAGIGRPTPDCAPGSSRTARSPREAPAPEPPRKSADWRSCRSHKVNR